MNSPVSKLLNALKQKGLDGLFISSPANVSYLSGFSGTESFLLITKDKNFFITDFRYLYQAQKQLQGFDIICKSRKVLKEAVKLINNVKLKRIGFEAEHLSFQDAQFIKNKTKAGVVPAKGLVEKLRICKTDEEIKKIKKASSIAQKALKKTIRFIRPGLRELEVAGFLEHSMKADGAERIAFPSIVASGENACMPHAVTSDRVIRKGEPIIIDCGCTYCGYNSDLTRTIFLGKMNALFNNCYTVVKAAQKKAISKVRPGKRISSIDKAARDFIKSKKLGERFGHATGHGIGREVHEAPRVSSASRGILRPGMVFSIEPAVYIPGWGGVRIEDLILVTNKSYKILTE